jgi:hypothetical protein
MIYCNGDSFTQGTELYDHIFFKDIHPGFRLAKDIFDLELRDILIKKHHEAILKKVNTPEENMLIHNETIKRAWPAKLEKLLNIPVVNAGEGGSSMDSICSRTITDILKLVSKGERINLAIIQVTFINRFDISVNDKMISIMHSHHDERAVSSKMGMAAYEYGKVRIANETIFSMYKNWLFNLVHLINFFKANNIHYMLVQSLPYFNPTGEHEDLKNLENYINLDFDLSMFEICKRLPEDVYAFCPGGHVTEIVHEELAKEIAEKYENRFRH